MTVRIDRDLGPFAHPNRALTWPQPEGERIIAAGHDLRVVTDPDTGEEWLVAKGMHHSQPHYAMAPVTGLGGGFPGEVQAQKNLARMLGCSAAGGSRP